MSTQLSDNMELAASVRPATDNAGVARKLSQLLARSQLPLFMLATGLALIYGWQVREEEYWTAESGFGYALGIIGGSLMLSQFLYPMRKNLRMMRTWGRISTWFKWHMAVGIIGPVMILYHANFGLGSINSNVALAAMALVVSSGLVGRYIYTKINQTLHGRVATLEELKQATDAARSDLKRKMVMDDAIIEALHRHEDETLKADRSWFAVLPQLAVLGFRTRFMRWRLKRRLVREMKSRARDENWNRKMLRAHVRAGKRHISTYVLRVRKVAEFRIYRRIFSLWHVLHIPLFIMLVVSGIAHVIAVHLY